MYRIAVVDTGNYKDYPIGGQLTSILNFLKYAGERKQDSIEFVLIGITTKKDAVGKTANLSINGESFVFLPVLYNEDCPQKPVESLRKAFMKALFKHRSIIRGLYIDLFFIHAPEAYLPLKLCFYNKKFAVFSHGSFFNIFSGIRFKEYKNPVIKLLLQKYIKYVLKTAELVFALDDQSMNEYGVYCRNLRKVGNSIDTGLFKREFRHKTGNTITAVYVGRLSANKNIGNIIHAFSMLEDRYILQIIGEGEEYDSLEGTINTLGIGGRVILAGRKSQEELIDIYAASDVLILNSYKEGLPMVVLEALSAGLCILSTPVGAIPEVVRDGVNGYHIDGSSRCIAEKLAGVEKDLFRFYRNNTAAAEKFSYKTVNGNIYDALQELLYPKR